MAEELAKRGVRALFCITGAGNLALVDALERRGDVEIIYCHHEQAVVMAAQGYARLSGEVGVALVTTGGGAANAFTGVLSANLDSVPILVVSGNESSYHCIGMAQFRAYGVQGFDSVSALRPVTKMASRIMSDEEIVYLLQRSWTAASTGRKGVSFLDFPMDIQRMAVDRTAPQTDGQDHQEARVSGRFDSASVSSCAKSLVEAKRPMLYLGNGVRDVEALTVLRSIIDRLQLPFFLSWSAVDLIEDEHPLNMGRVGIYGDRAANLLLQKCDFLLCIGTRLAIPQTGYDKDDFARRAERWVVDVDVTELSKFSHRGWQTVASSAELFGRELDSTLEALDSPTTESWVTECNRVWEKLQREDQVGPKPQPDSGYVHSSDAIEVLNSLLPSSAVVVTDVGAGLLSGHYSIRIKPGQRMFTSQGLGEMGFGLPGAIGAYFADKSRPVFCLNTDGALMFNLQELATVQAHRIPLRLFVFNNGGYGMIKISQDNLFDSRHAGISPATGVGFPDFGELAKVFGMTHFRITSPDQLTQSLREYEHSSNALMFEVMMSPEQQYLPRLATRRVADGSLSSPPLEDLDPPLQVSEIEDFLGYPAQEATYSSRGLPRAE